MLDSAVCSRLLWGMLGVHCVANALQDLELQGGLQKVPVQASVGAGEAELGDKGASSSWLTSIINGVRVWTRG